MRDVMLVAGRELTETFRSRAYWITMAIMIVAALVVVSVPRIFASERSFELAIAGDTPAGLDADLALNAARADIDLDVVTTPDGDVWAAVEHGDVDAALAFEDGEVVLVREADTSGRLVRVAEDSVLTANLRLALLEEGSTAEAVDRALGLETVAEEVVDEDQEGRDAVGYLISFLLYIALLLGGTSVATGVAVEKSTRISEVLVTTLRPTRLLAGKVLGIGVATLLLLGVVAVPLISAVIVSVIGAPPATVAEAFGGFGWFVLGYAIYAIGFAALGALVDRQEDLAGAVAPLNVMLLLSFLAGIQAQVDPDGPLAVATSLFPLSAPMVMPVRVAHDAASAMEIGAAVVIGILTFLALVRIGGAIYQRALLRGGRRLRLADVWRG